MTRRFPLGDTKETSNGALRTFTSHLNSGMAGLLDYLQLLSGPDQVHRPYNTSYPTYFIAVSSRTALLGPQRLVISCLLFRCANPLAKIYYATFLWDNRRHPKLFVQAATSMRAFVTSPVLNCCRGEDSNPARYLLFRSCSLFGLYVSQSIHFRLPDC